MYGLSEESGVSKWYYTVHSSCAY